jgi:glutathione synthase
MEVNVFSPGGLGRAEAIHEVDFCVPVNESLERKVAYVGIYDEQPLSNRSIATL